MNVSAQNEYTRLTYPRIVRNAGLSFYIASALLDVDTKLIAQITKIQRYYIFEYSKMRSDWPLVKVSMISMPMQIPKATKPDQKMTIAKLSPCIFLV